MSEYGRQAEQDKLIDRVFNALHEAGVLEYLLVVGSWRIYFYVYHFKYERISRLRTTDIDFDVDLLLKVKSHVVNIPNLLKSLNFEIQFSGDNFTFLVNPGLKIEFLASEIGRGADKPLKLTGFGITAQPLRFLDMLKNEILTVNYKRMPVNVPHPVWFALHKLVISQRRMNKQDNTGKIKKDITQAINVLEMLVEINQKDKIFEAIEKLTKKQRKLARQALNDPAGKNILKMKEKGFLDFLYTVLIK